MPRRPLLSANGVRDLAAGLLLLAAPFVSPCSAENPGRIEGTVVAAETGAAISGAVVQLDGLLPDGTRIPPTRTDNSGKFAFPRLPGNSRWLLVVAPGDEASPYVAAVPWAFEHFGDAIRVEVKPTSVTRVTIKLRRGGEILVRTVRRDGTPWAGFEASVSRPDLSRINPPGGGTGARSIARSGGEHLFRGVPASTPLVLDLEPKGHAKVVESPIVVAIGERRVVDLIVDLDDPTGIEGVAAPNTWLTLYSNMTGEDVAEYTVGPDGRFAIVGLAPGRYTITFRGGALQADVRAGAKTWLEIPPSAGAVPRGPSPREPTQTRRSPKVEYCPGLTPTVSKRMAVEAQFKEAYGEAVEKLLTCLPESCLRHLKPRLFEGAAGKPFTFTIRCFNPPCGEYRAPPFSNPNTGDVNIMVGWDAFMQPPSATCGCLASVVFHEITHHRNAYDECPAYKCAKRCFSCAVQDFSNIEVQTSLGTRSIQCPDDTPCCQDCK